MFGDTLLVRGITFEFKRKNGIIYYGSIKLPDSADQISRTERYIRTNRIKKGGTLPAKAEKNLEWYIKNSFPSS